MARRNGFNDEDLTVIADIVGKQITAELKTETVEMLAPLFRIREKVLTMKGKGSTKPVLVKAARAPRASTPNVAPSSTD